jgi:predicted RNase H-like nuclease (RuvC/YqgF family)
MSKYEVKLVNIGEEVDNKIRELEIEVKDIRKANDNLTRANESYRQENIDLRKSCHLNEVLHLRKENVRLQARLENDEHNVGHLDKKMDRLAFLEKLHSQHRYVFSEIPNTEENMKMVKLMKKHINKDRYNLRWRGQYLIDGEDWKKYTDGQPMNKSKCIRVYIDSKDYDTTEGFKESEVQTIINALDTHIDKCQEFVSTWEVEGETDDEDVTWNKQDIKQSKQLLSYFTSMQVHLEESKLARAEVVNQNLSASK